MRSSKAHPLEAGDLPGFLYRQGRFLLDLRSVLDKQSKQTQSEHSVQEKSAVSSISFGIAAMVDEFASTDQTDSGTGVEGDEAHGAADEQDYEFRASHDQNCRIERIVVEV
ncbi:hypothetical protein H0H93_013175 [Arthromyces matolae]|nr:hypothetical protein H0H93_013175 [Arthromyces matolae]